MVETLLFYTYITVTNLYENMKWTKKEHFCKNNSQNPSSHPIEHISLGFMFHVCNIHKVFRNNGTVTNSGYVCCTAGTAGVTWLRSCELKKLTCIRYSKRESERNSEHGRLFAGKLIGTFPFNFRGLDLLPAGFIESKHADFILECVYKSEAILFMDLVANTCWNAKSISIAKLNT